MQEHFEGLVLPIDIQATRGAVAWWLDTLSGNI